MTVTMLVTMGMIMREQGLVGIVFMVVWSWRLGCVFLFAQEGRSFPRWWVDMVFGCAWIPDNGAGSVDGGSGA